MWKYIEIILIVSSINEAYGSEAIMPCSANSTQIIFNLEEGQDVFTFSTSDNCDRQQHALAGSRLNMRCTIDTTTDADFQAFMDVWDPADFSTNYLQSLCFSVRNVDRVTVFMGRFGGQSLTFEESIPNNRKWTEVCLPEPYVGQTYDYFDWLIKLHVDEPPNRSRVKVKDLELIACNFLFAP